MNLGPLGSFDGGDFASLSFGATLLYRFARGDSGNFSGFVGPGVACIQEISFESNHTALEFELGGRYTISERLFVESSFDYLLAGDVSIELPADRTQTISADYDHWSVNIGLGCRFQDSL